MKRSLRSVWTASLVALPAVAALAQSPTHVAMIAYRVTNRGASDAASVTAHVILPASNRYQEVGELEIYPQPTREYIDGEGQRVVSVPLGTIPAGQSRAVRVLAWVKLKNVTVSLAPTAAKDEPLSDILEQAYLQDSRLLQLDRVRAIAEEAVGARTQDVHKARALYDYMAKNCHYNIDEQMDAASQVLEGKPASCSELAYTFVALCRSVGIPARTVAAFVNRGGRSPSVDWRAHRWAEFHVNGIGWVPVDPTNKLNHPSDNYFGRQLGKYLVLLDDGVGSPVGPDPGWQVFMAHAESGFGQLFFRRSAVWRVSNNRQQEAAFFKQANDVLHDPDAATRREAVPRWARQRELLKGAFLLEALFDADPGVRKAAAAALGESGDGTIMLALMKRAQAESDEDVKRALVDAARKLLRISEDEDRAEAVQELAKSRTDQALELLDGIWEDETRDVRKAAAQMLYKFGDKPAVHEAYRELVDDDDEFIRLLAALRWARVGSHQALQELVGHLESSNSWDREKALGELEKRTGDDFGYAPKSRPTLRRNREAIAKFSQWLEDHPDEK